MRPCIIMIGCLHDFSNSLKFGMLASVNFVHRNHNIFQLETFALETSTIQKCLDLDIPK